ncbi:MAG: magnesium transporter CorA family protein [Candidatus Methanomethylicia archaeon]|nr:magnesium transporter CorA family protein [Candidatus Methanomethylicia archaeon]
MSAGIRWVDIVKPTKEEVFALSKEFPFHALNLEDCISKIQLTKIEKHDDHLFIILRFPFACEKAGCSPTQISSFIGKDYLVTIHEASLGAINDVFSSCQSQIDETGEIKAKNVGSLFYWILSTIANTLFPLMESIMDRIEAVEDSVFDIKKPVLLEISRLRRSISDLRRILSPIKRIAPEISLGINEITGEDLTVYFNDLRDKIDKIWDLTDTAKEIIDIFKDTDFTLSQERMNRALVILTVIFTATIPATIIGTYYGMNIVLPGGLDAEPWTFLGPYTTLIVLSSLAILLAGIMLAYFKRLGWF